MKVFDAENITKENGFPVHDIDFCEDIVVQIPLGSEQGVVLYTDYKGFQAKCYLSSKLNKVFYTNLYIFK
jgi:hypothetical protein